MEEERLNYKEILRKNHCFLRNSFLSNTTLFFTIVELFYQAGIMSIYDVGDSNQAFFLIFNPTALRTAKTF